GTGRVPALPSSVLVGHYARIRASGGGPRNQPRSPLGGRRGGGWATASPPRDRGSRGGWWATNGIRQGASGPGAGPAHSNPPDGPRGGWSSGPPGVGSPPASWVGPPSRNVPWREVGHQPPPADGGPLAAVGPSHVGHGSSAPSPRHDRPPATTGTTSPA